jgi:hypothetical protein
LVDPTTLHHDVGEGSDIDFFTHLEVGNRPGLFLTAGQEQREQEKYVLKPGPKSHHPNCIG